MARNRDRASTALDQALKARAAEADGRLYEKLADKRVRCHACAHRCLVLEGLDGICRVRFNRQGTLYAPRNYVAGLQVDPIEKKPFFHVFPGADALSFGMLGCDLHCPYCQNWLSSQTLRDKRSSAETRDVSSDEIVALARRHASPVIVSTYNEPLITSDWAGEIFAKAHAAGIVCGFVSNGNATPEVLQYLRPHMQLYKVDLKSFRDEAYRQCGGKLQNVLDSLAKLVELEFWIEVVTLLVPGFNDSEQELEAIAGFLVSLSPDIPWHVTAFRRTYKMTDPENTTAADLLRAAEIGKAAGLHYVYAGNLPGQVAGWENTYCPACDELLIARSGYTILQDLVSNSGSCPACEHKIAGFWRGKQGAVADL